MPKLAAAAPLFLAACSTVPTARPAQPVAGSCNAEGLANYVGREATAKTGGEIMRQSGARVVRWVPKGAMITMEFSADRVTINLDENNRVERINCG
jgi:hypothetical protein